MEDYIIDDYGEVFINHNGTIYPIIIGTGYLQVYSMVRYLQTLARVHNVEEEFCSILEYSKTIIEFTKETNIPNVDQEIVYELPNEEFWITIAKLFEDKTFQKQAQDSLLPFPHYSDSIPNQSQYNSYFNHLKNDTIYFIILSFASLPVMC